MNIPIIKGDRVSEKTDYRDALPVNSFAVIREILGTKGYMLAFPGISSFATGEGVDRGANFNERFGQHFRLSGEKLIKLNPDGTTENLGVIPGLNQAALPNSFNTQAIIADGRFFLYDQTNGLVEVIDPDLGYPIDGTWIDGYYFLTDGEYIYHTDITNESSIDPLKFATAEFMPDKSLGVSVTQDDKVIVWGRYTIEYFTNIAQANFAFKRLETRAQKIGIVATHAKCEAGPLWYITGSRKNDSLGVYAISVGQSEKVSTREIDKILAEYKESDLKNMRMEARKEEDYQFIIVHLPEHTLCFNETVARQIGATVAWTILESGDKNYRAINTIFDSNTGFFICGDKFDNRIGKIDNTVFSQYDEPVQLEIYSPFINLETFSIDELRLETLPGTSPDNDATVGLSFTVDGLTYTPDYWMMYGENQRFIIYRLGYVADWVGFKFRALTKSRMSFANLQLRVS